MLQYKTTKRLFEELKEKAKQSPLDGFLDFYNLLPISRCSSHWNCGNCDRKEMDTMDNTPFTFRRFKEEDADILYEEYADFCWNNIQPYFSGVGVGMTKSDFLKEIEAFANKQYRPPIVVNADDEPIGIYRITYRRAHRYHELMLHLWNDKHLSEPVLKAIIDQALHRERPDDSLLVEIPGYEPELKQAADSLGLDHAGVIPNYLRHGENLFHKYSYVTTSSDWYSDR